MIAGILFYADYKLGWDATKAYTGPACVAYFVLNGLLTYWIWAVEAGTVFVGTREGGQKVRPLFLSLSHTHTHTCFKPPKFSSSTVSSSLSAIPILTITLRGFVVYTVDPKILDSKVQTKLQTQSVLRGAVGQKVARQRDRRLIHTMVQHPRIPAKEGTPVLAGTEH